MSALLPFDVIPLTAGIVVATSIGALLVRGVLRSRRSHNMFVRLAEDIELPVSISGPDDEPLVLVAAHGLGSSDPSQKHHTCDLGRELVEPLLGTAGLRALFYTARGHGHSTGWQWHGSEQFTWPKLAGDMIGVADVHGLKRFVAMGNSMGAATAVHAAFNAPDRITALVLYRLPTAWEAREARRLSLLEKSDQLREALPRWPYHEVLRGAAECNLPPKKDEVWTTIRHIPALVLCHEEDEVHPVATSKAVHALLPRSTLHVAANLEAAKAEFPAVLVSWLRGIVALDRDSDESSKLASKAAPCD